MRTARVLVCGGFACVAAAAGAQLLPDPAAGTEANSATAYTEEGIGDVDPLGRSTRWMDPAQEADLMRDRVLRTRPMTPGEAAAAALAPGADTARSYVYRRPGVRATFHRPAYITWTLDGPRVNGAPAYEGGFKEVIPPDTVFDLTVAPVAPPELTAFSAGMRVDGRVPPEPAPFVAPAPRPPAAAPAARELQPWVRVRRTPEGRLVLDESGRQ